MNTGVYTITNLINGKMYVGSTTVSFFKRKQKHWSQLNNNNKRNPHLQAAWNKHGKENFIFEILEETTTELAVYAEQYWINMLNTVDRKYGYNLIVPNGNGFSGKHTEESKKKMSLVQKGKPCHPNSLAALSLERGPHSLETKLKISAANKGKLKGRTISQEHKDKISQYWENRRNNKTN